ncbi:WXG100 family type VII secretion target [Streptomyces sp. V2I9]|uniref:WXG100 family type VII secretion target n=1 Tax=Streptomyces sp. V2I9 TaxID=3042304 RepID=UPI00278A5CA5|nr:WXG100 family type VII secretion target [Streptomyces sp. V2I9]MDQ0988459.1 WXG100 family type VII secretion target [Streptomyces sp. V2I9]
MPGENLTDGIIDVQYNAAANAALSIQQQTKAIEGTLKALEAELQALSTGWAGDDQREYTKVQQQWNAAVSAMQQLLLENGALLEHVADSHKKDERRNSQMWQEVSAR